MWQFIFICLVVEVEVNAVQSSWACGMCESTLPQLQYHRELAKQMLKNTINVQVGPVVVLIHTRHERNMEHLCLQHGIYNGTWNPTTHQFNWVKMDYVFYLSSVQQMQSKKGSALLLM